MNDEITTFLHESFPDGFVLTVWRPANVLHLMNNPRDVQGLDDLMGVVTEASHLIEAGVKPCVHQAGGSPVERELLEMYKRLEAHRAAEDKRARVHGAIAIVVIVVCGALLAWQIFTQATERSVPDGRPNERPVRQVQCEEERR